MKCDVISLVRMSYACMHGMNEVKNELCVLCMYTDTDI